jgi:hypothetical protein
MEAGVLAAVDTAELNGWSPEEAAAALVELADNYMLSVLANRELTREVVRRSEKLTP